VKGFWPAKDQNPFALWAHAARKLLRLLRARILRIFSWLIKSRHGLPAANHHTVRSATATGKVSTASVGERVHL
jgi:hypothetical protein